MDLNSAGQNTAITNRYLRTCVGIARAHRSKFWQFGIRSSLRRGRLTKSPGQFPAEFLNHRVDGLPIRISQMSLSGMFYVFTNNLSSPGIGDQ